MNISSVAGITGSGSSVAYCKQRCPEYDDQITGSCTGAEIRVNAVCPGPIESRWIREGNPDVSIESMVENYPLPKTSMPDDIADAVLFFALGTAYQPGSGSASMVGKR